MAQRRRPIFSSLLLVAGLSLWTLAPYGGCSCSNPMGASAPNSSLRIYGGAQAGKVPATLVDDFEDGFTSRALIGHWQNVYINGILNQVWYNGNSPAYRVDLWGGGTYTQADSFGSQYFSILAAPGGGPDTSSSCLQFGSPSSMYGRTSPQLSCAPTTCGAIYPFVEHGMFLSPQNAAGDANVEFSPSGQSVPGVDNVANGGMAGHGLMITYNVLSNQLTVKLKLLYLSNYTNTAPCTNSDAFAFHYKVVPATGGIWSVNYKIPFSAFSLKPNFANPNYTSPSGAKIGINLIYGAGATIATLADPAARVDGNGNPINTLRISAIEFDASAPTTGPPPTLLMGCSTQQNNFPLKPYDFQIDNVEFY